jgi:hypothetical protein
MDENTPARLGHVVVGVLAARNAATAFNRLETQLDVWLTGLLRDLHLHTKAGATR